MARHVDHRQRRLEVLAAARRVIIRDGIEAATTRAIAREAGYSSGVLSHYFDDKDDILSSLLRQSHERVRQRRVRRTAGVTGLAALRELLLDSLPLDAERTREARLEIDFWSRGLSAEHLAEVQRREHAKLRAATRRRLAEAHRAGEITLPRTPPPEVLDDIAGGRSSASPEATEPAESVEPGEPARSPEPPRPERNGDAAGPDDGDAAAPGDAGARAEDADQALDEELEAVTQRLLALVDGLSLHLLLYPDRLTRSDAERLVLAELATLTQDADQPASSPGSGEG